MLPFSELKFYCMEKHICLEEVLISGGLKAQDYQSYGRDSPV